MQLTVKEVSRILSISEKSVYTLIKKNGLPAHQVHRMYLVNKTELVEWALNNSHSLSAEFFTSSQTTPDPVPAVTFRDILDEKHIFHEVAGEDKGAVLRSLCNVLPFVQEQERQQIFSALMAREMLNSTAIGNGIAIPHVRNPIILNLQKPHIFIAFLKNPVEFGALDNKMVHVLFLLLSTTTQLHLHLLARLSYVLQNPAVTHALETRSNATALMNTIIEAENQILARLPERADAAHEKDGSQ